MIALTVFSIGILAVMRVITQNLTAMDKAETTTVATFLAKEGIELAYNVRDSNLQKWLPRNCMLTSHVLWDVYDDVEPDQACMSYFSSGVAGSIVLLGLASSGYFFMDTKPLASWASELFDQSRLYHFTQDIQWKSLSWYGYTWDHGQESFFARYILFTWVQVSWQILPMQNILKIESHVLSRKWSAYQDTVLESFIGKQ